VGNAFRGGDLPHFWTLSSTDGSEPRWHEKIQVFSRDFSFITMLLCAIKVAQEVLCSASH
jgi:hypothetical protein